MVVVEKGCVTRLSVGKDAVEGGMDVGSDLGGSKRWGCRWVGH